MSHQSSPILTIVMPVFNHPELFSVMIDSIIANDFQEWELLAVDDGSEENALQRLGQYESMDVRIRVIQRNEQPKGAQTCRNIGLREAKGEFIVFFDSDDYITPVCLRNRVERLRERPDLDFMVFPSGTYVDDIFLKVGRRDIYGYPLYHDDIKAFARRTLPFIVWNNIYRTSSLRKYDIVWDTRLKSLQDADFNLQALLAGMKYEYVHCVPDYGYRISTTDSVSKKIVVEEHYRSHLYALEKFYIEVQKRFGHRYDRALYQGVLFVYVMVFGEGVNITFANKIVQLVNTHSKWYGMILGAQVKCSMLLGYFLPKKRARQIPVLLYLLRRSWREQRNKRVIAKLLFV